MGNLSKDSAIPRHFVFALTDGTYIIQWSEARVQELLTGSDRAVASAELGEPISDVELEQLKREGHIADFDRSYVWLGVHDDSRATDEHPAIRNWGRARVRSYYLNTTLPGEEIEHIREMLRLKGLDESYVVDVYNDLVIVLDEHGAAFTDLMMVEDTQTRLVASVPEVFTDSAVAFVETSGEGGAEATPSFDGQKPAEAVLDADLSVTRGKRALVVGGSAEERGTLTDLLSDMALEVEQSGSAFDALHTLEDFRPDLVVMDLQLSDMHGWEMLSKVREIHSLRQCAVIALDDRQASQDNETLALTVAKVDFYMVKPVTEAQLQQSVVTALKKKQGR